MNSVQNVWRDFVEWRAIIHVANPDNVRNVVWWRRWQFIYWACRPPNMWQLKMCKIHNVIVESFDMGSCCNIMIPNEHVSLWLALRTVTNFYVPCLANVFGEKYKDLEKSKWNQSFQILWGHLLYIMSFQCHFPPGYVDCHEGEISPFLTFVFGFPRSFLGKAEKNIR